MLGDDRVERLVPAEGMGGDDGGLVAADDRQQLGQLDARGNLVERREAVDQEMALARRDLGPREDAQGRGEGGELGELLRAPTDSRAR